MKLDYAPPRYQLGKLLVQGHQPEAARHELELAVQCQPEFAQAYYQLAQLGESGKAHKRLPNSTT